MQKLAVYTLGFLQVPYIRKMLRIAGWRVRPGPISKSASAVGVWGRKPLSRRGILAARRRGLPLLSIEDAFLRSVIPGPKTAPAGLVLDDIGIFFDASQPSKLENILNFDALDDDELTRHAKNGIAFLRHYGLSKYNPVPRGSGTIPQPGYVLVVDQTRGDASIAGGAAHAHSFATMLAKARADHPEKRIVIRTHPALEQIAKQGHFSAADTDERTILLSEKINPWDLLERAVAVYCVTSQLGFEAILAGHRPVVFGLPFYAGWGLSEDIQTCARRTRKLSAEQLFAGAMLRFPTWIDLSSNRLSNFALTAQALLARSQHHWHNSKPSVAVGMRNWKRPQVSKFLKRPVFGNAPLKAAQQAQKRGGRVVVWANQESPALKAACANHGVELWRMEDGFLRSKGLGAALTPPESVVLDDLSIYYDPIQPSRLEKLIEASVDLPEIALSRATQLIKQITKGRISKYNLVLPPPTQPITGGKPVILVPGQVEDDASIRLGAGEVSTNLALLKATRAANPDAFIIYKPHPDIEAGLRPGALENPDLFADAVADNAPISPFLDMADEVWTMTSLTGFEALLRGKKVTCLGMPFYAGWGLTNDLAPPQQRRKSRPSLAGLVHATLIDYPLYLDPKNGRPCSPEKLVERLQNGEVKSNMRLILLAKLQGRFASYTHLWR